MRSLFIALFISTFSFGQTSPTPTASPRKDILKYAQQLQQGQVDEQLQSFLKSKVEEKCKEKTDQTEKLDCITKEFQTQMPTDENEIKKLSDKLNLSKFNLVKSDDTKSVRSYLSFRLCENLQGVGSPVCEAQRKVEMGQDGGIVDFNQIKLVDQLTYHELYNNQLGKNLISDISEFCLDHIKLAPVTTTTTDDVFTVEAVDNTSAKAREDVIKTEIVENKDPNAPAFLKFKFEFCATNIDPICENAKPQNKNFSSVDQKINDLVKNKACFLRNKIRSYRKAIAQMAATATIYEQMRNDGAMGFALSATSAGTYNNENNDKITSLTSVEVAKAMDLKDLSGKDSTGKDKYAELQKDFENKCKLNDGEKSDDLLNDPNCKNYISRASTSDIEKAKEIVELQHVATASLLDSMANKGKLKDYLKENGFEKDLQDLETGKMTEKEIAQKINDKYKAEKKSIICEINAKAGIINTDDCGDRNKEAVVILEKGKEEALPSVRKSVDAGTIKNNISERIADTAKSQESLFRYNNVISSFLALQDKNGTSKTREDALKENRLREINDLKKDPVANNSDTEWFTLLGGNSSSSSGASRNVAGEKSSGQSVVDLNFIDTLLGNKKTDTQAK